MPMAYWKHYSIPGSVQEALSVLADCPGAARVIAGGTDLLLDLSQGRLPPVHTLVDVTRIPELQAVREEGGRIFVGAAVTHAQILRSDLLRSSAACLVEASALIGGPQVRNVATIGGNVAHALPAGDGTIALLALDAEGLLAGPEGTRWEPVERLFEGPGVAAFLRDREILVGFRFAPARPPARTAFRRVMRPQGVAIAILNTAVWVRWGSRLEIEEIRIALGPAGPRPFRARAAEAVLRGNTLEEDSVEEAASAIRAEAQLRSSPHRATQEYRRHLIGILLGRALRAASPLADREVGPGGRT
jgi:carbon-monoxide dehydrogenase medium subunit